MDDLERLLVLEKQKTWLIGFVDTHVGADKRYIENWWWDIYKKYEPDPAKLDNIQAWIKTNQEFKSTYIYRIRR